MSTITTETNKNGDLQPRTPLIFHDEGDVTLLIGDPRCPQSVRVSKTVMSLASPVWKALFSPHRWSESSATEISFPDDDIDAMLLVLRIAHLRHDELSGEKALDYNAVLALAMLCDKYDMLKTVRPFLALYQLATTFEPYEQLSLTECPPSCLQMTYLLGLHEGFDRLACYMSKTIATTEMTPPPSFNGHPLQVDELPPNIMENILRVREDSLSAMLQACYDIVDELMNSRHCKVPADEVKEEQSASGCRYMILGSYLEGLTKAGLYPKRLSGSEVRDSVCVFKNKLSGVKVQSYPAAKHSPYHSPYSSPKRPTDSHQTCVDVVNLKERAEAIFRSMPSPVLDSHRRYIAKQAGK